MNLNEGGNVFKDSAGQPLTQRINQADVMPTAQWLEKITGLDLTKDKDKRDGKPVKWLGSTGRKADSGDLDLSVDAGEMSKDQLVTVLAQWAKSKGVDPAKYIKKTGSAVHFFTAIGGDPKNGFVQTDFMFSNKPRWTQFVLSSDPRSQYKGALRNIMMNSMAKALGYKLNQLAGIADRATNEIITDDPDQVAKLLLNKSATRADLASVESILVALEQDPARDQKLADFREHMKREGLPFMESESDPLYTDVSDVNFLARLRDRIVNQGMQVIVEAASPRIEHLEDLVFEKGSRGIQEAIAIIEHAAENTAKTTTVKWDGKPAIIFGRNESGEFVLTDKSGFTAKGYDGRATNVAQLANIMNQRGSGRGELIAIYEKLFPLLRAATPENFKGYVQGDLLYTEAPQEISGNYEFKPNVVEYRIPIDSKLGQLITGTEVGVAIHTRYKTADSDAEAIGNLKLNPVPGLLLIEPSVKDIQNVKPESQRVKQLKQLVRAKGPAIDGLFNPAELRAAGITDLPQLCKRYINSRIDTNYENLLPDFGAWLQKNTTPRKFNNIVEYLQSPRSNMDGIASAFTAFLGLHDLKMNMLQQLDLQQPGQEGWVLATPAGRAKLVNRFGFSAANRAQNNPKMATS